MAGEMTFWEHLDELRKVIFRSFAVIIVLMVMFFLCKETVFDGVVLAPLTDGFFVYRWMDRLLGLLGIGALEPFRVELVNIDLAAQFFTHVRISFWLAVIVAMPFLIYQVWLFVRPALYDREKRAAQTAFGLSSLLFYIGVGVGYVALSGNLSGERVGGQPDIAALVHRDVPEAQPDYGRGLRAAGPGPAAVPDRDYQPEDAEEFPQVRDRSCSGHIGRHHPIGRRLHDDSRGTAFVSALRGVHNALQG